LSQAVRALNGERERLAARLDLVERRLEDLTGSISLTQPLRRPPRVVVEPVWPVPEAGMTREPEIPAVVASISANNPLAVKPAAPIEAPEIPAPEPAPTPPPSADRAPEPPAETPQANAVDVPLPRPSPLAVPASMLSPRPRLGIDLGAAASVEGLRGLWTRLRDSQTPLLADLRPLISVKESRPGRVELRLVAGPVANAAAAARLCAALAASAVPCRATAFDGQKLTVQ
jgi:hypothetical protein